MSSVASKHCVGCCYDHPSQLEHDVCVMAFEDQVYHWFDEAMTLVDEDVVIGKWLGNLGNLQPTVQYHDVSRYLDPEFRLEWTDTEWKADVKQKLISLEHHPH